VLVNRHITPIPHDYIPYSTIHFSDLVGESGSS